MVTYTDTSGHRSGVVDWLVQRSTAVILFAYFAFLAYVFAGGVTFAQWSSLFDQVWMKVFTSLAAVSLAAHAWIGMWGVFTDYLTERLLGPKGNTMRGLMQAVTTLSLIIFVAWSVQIVWL
ncbi:MAG: succinate dehydrogenase, hydrophobic membrane anchor protein [Pseudomonadota bacterium]